MRPSHEPTGFAAGTEGRGGASEKEFANFCARNKKGRAGELHPIVEPFCTTYGERNRPSEPPPQKLTLGRKGGSLSRE